MATLTAWPAVRWQVGRRHGRHEKLQHFKVVSVKVKHVNNKLLSPRMEIADLNLKLEKNARI